jgi:hypothetical protein
MASSSVNFCRKRAFVGRSIVIRLVHDKPLVGWSYHPLLGGAQMVAQRRKGGEGPKTVGGKQPGQSSSKHSSSSSKAIATVSTPRIVGFGLAVAGLELIAWPSIARHYWPSTPPAPPPPNSPSQKRATKKAETTFGAKYTEHGRCDFPPPCSPLPAYSIRGTGKNCPC